MEIRSRKGGGVSRATSFTIRGSIGALSRAVATRAFQPAQRYTHNRSFCVVVRM